jgi:hypothetical protein
MRYFGDSYDIVKQSLIRWLADFGQWSAHPMFPEGVAGCGAGTHPFYSQFQGIYTNRSQHTLGQLTVLDGTSNTLLYGELAGTHWNSPPDTKDICWMAGGGLGTYLGLQRARTAPIITFSSWHAAGVQF